MSNVLGTLFGQIADAIRGKTGDTATMKPAEFPDKIAAIEAGGGAGATGEIKVKTGDFYPSSTVGTFTHGLGVVPDILLITPSFPPVKGDIAAAIGFRSALNEAMGGGKKGRTTFIISGTMAGHILTDGMETPQTGSAGDNGALRSVNENTFTIGSASGNAKLRVSSGCCYSYIAVAGLI